MGLGADDIQITVDGLHGKPDIKMVMLRLLTSFRYPVDVDIENVLAQDFNVSQSRLFPCFTKGYTSNIRVPICMPS